MRQLQYPDCNLRQVESSINVKLVDCQPPLQTSMVQGTMVAAYHRSSLASHTETRFRHIGVYFVRTTHAPCMMVSGILNSVSFSITMLGLW